MASKATRTVQVHQAVIPAQKTTPTAAQAISLAHLNFQNQDLIQVVNSSGRIIYNLNSAGVATTNPTTPTSQALLGKFLGATFQLAFPGANDVYQILQNGAVVFRIDNTGTAFTS